MLTREECILYSGGANGAEDEFGVQAARGGRDVGVGGRIVGAGPVGGGAGGVAEFAKLCNKPIFVFDQDADRWFRWAEDRWVEVTDAGGPRIRSPRLTGTRTRFLAENGRGAL